MTRLTGFAKDKAEKRYFVNQRWLPAVNAQRETMGMLPWHFVEVTDIERIKNQLTEEIARIAAEVDEQVAQSVWGVFKLIAQLPEDIFPNGRRDDAAYEVRQGLIDHDD